MSYGDQGWNGGRAPTDSLSSMGGSEGGRGQRRAPDPVINRPDPSKPQPERPVDPVINRPDPVKPQPDKPGPVRPDPDKPLDPVLDKSRKTLGSRLTLNVMRQRDIRLVNDKHTSNQSTSTRRSDLDPRDNRQVCKARPESNKPSGSGGSFKRMVFVPWCDRS